NGSFDIDRWTDIYEILPHLGVVNTVRRRRSFDCVGASDSVGVHQGALPRDQEKNASLILSPHGGEMYADLLRHYNDGECYVLHFVTAWQMARRVNVLERGDLDDIRRVENFDYPF
ncbi:MAG: hypothetical protein KAJ17_07830, partial [Candidatus Krumholzibacteria bacterium]|nr:hypothetical protein [Candidatus Krumholzibacteria bacterium]